MYQIDNNLQRYMAEDLRQTIAMFRQFFLDFYLLILDLQYKDVVQGRLRFEQSISK